MALRVGRIGTSGMFRMNVVGLQELQRKLEALHREGVDLNEEIEEAVEVGLEKVREASNEICPIATGALRESAFVSVTRASNGRLRGYVGYGMFYAKWVHEDPDSRHAEGTGWKFLESAFIELRPELEQIISKATAAAIKSAVKNA